MVDDWSSQAIQCETREEWRAWLEAHADRREGVWLVTFRKGADRPQLGYEEMVEEALCFGWVDSRPGKVDDLRTRLWFAPRKPGSGWSRPNKERIARMLEQGRMTARGRAVVEAAVADGSWSRLDAVEELMIPPDLAEALAAHPPAERWFEAFPRSTKRGILEWIQQAKRPETRAQRITETARLAAENRRANQWPRPG